MSPGTADANVDARTQLFAAADDLLG